jgi:hypothetical protein
MKTVLIYHTCENFFASMKAALASTPLHLVHYNNYNKYALLDAMTMYRPNYVVIEKRSRLDVMELIIENHCCPVKF